MKHKILSFSVISFFAAMAFVSCGKKETTVTAIDPSFSEEFDTLSSSVKRGWVIANNSRPIGTLPWVQGFFYLSQNHDYDGKAGATNPYYYNGFGGMNPSFSGADFAMATANSGGPVSVISNWLISPAVMVKNGDIITFYTRTVDNPASGADRLQVRVNPVNGSADVGRDATSVGNFSEVLLDINPDYLLEGDGSYPGDWEQFTVVVSGMPGKNAQLSRIAFRYFVEDGGPAGNNSLAIGIDKFNFLSVNK